MNFWGNHMKYIIISDNIILCRQLQNLLACSMEEKATNIDMCSDPQRIFHSHKVYDAYFIDLDMEAMDGLKFMDMLYRQYVKAEMICISKCDSKMQEAFYRRPCAFIREKNLEEDMRHTIPYLMRLLEKKKGWAVVRDGSRFLKIKPSHILYCTSVEHYAYLVYKEGNKDILRTKIDELEEILSSFGFIRTHRRYLVNIKYISHAESQSLRLKNGESIPISRRMKKDVEIGILNWKSKL